MSHLQRLKFDVETAAIPGSTIQVMILSDFHSEGAHTKDTVPTNDEISRTDTQHRAMVMLSKKFNSLESPRSQTATNFSDFPQPDFSSGSTYHLSSEDESDSFYPHWQTPLPGPACTLNGTFT